MRLALAVNNGGGLGLLGAGSMYTEVLRHHICACKAANKNGFGVNIPLLYPEIDIGQISAVIKKINRRKKF